MSEDQINQAVEELLNPYMYWSTITNNVPNQVVLALQTNGYPDTNIENVFDVVNLCVQEDAKTLATISKYIRLDFEKEPELKPIFENFYNQKVVPYFKTNPSKTHSHE